MNFRSSLFTTLAVAAATVAIAPHAEAFSLTGLARNNTLIQFDSTNTTVTKTLQVTGVSGTLLGIDKRPANGRLYGLTDTNNVYTIDPNTGVAKFVSKLDTAFNGGTSSGFDFNPFADRLRLVGSNDQNLRINLDTNAVVVDGTLAYVSGDANFGADPNITAAAYTNSFAGTAATQLFGIDSALNTLVLQNPPNAGGLATIGSLGFDFAEKGGFDIFTDTDGVNYAIAASGDRLYSIDLASGAGTLLGSIGSDTGDLIGLAAVPVPEPTAGLGSLLVCAGLGLVRRFRRDTEQSN